MTVGAEGEGEEEVGENILPRCFFDIEIGGLPAGRVVFELFKDSTPKTAENFRGLCTGEYGIGKTTEKPLHFKGSVFHRVIKDFMIQGGDISNNNGSGGESIYGGTFEDENFERKHDAPFLLSMANRGPSTNGSQFFILTQPAPHLNDIHVVFGRVVNGQTVIKQVESIAVDRKSRPLQDVRIINSGELVLLKKKNKEKKPRKEKKKRKQKIKKESSSEKSSGEISDSSNSDSSTASERKTVDKEKEKHKQLSETMEVSHPLVTETVISENEIPADPPKKFLSRGLGKDNREENREENKKGRRDRSRDRSRSRSRDRRTSDRNRDSREWRGDRDGQSGSRYVSNLSATGRKIKGRGRVCYRDASRSRSRSKTPPHWKAETRKKITMKEFQLKESARRQREEEIRRRQEERQKRHDQDKQGGNDNEDERRQKSAGEVDDNDDEVANVKSSTIATTFDNLEGSPISTTLIETLTAEASNSDGIVYYQHLYAKGRENKNNAAPSETSFSKSSKLRETDLNLDSVPSTTQKVSTDDASFLIAAQRSEAQATSGDEEEIRLRRELLKKRMKDWEESSEDEDGKLKSVRSKTIAETENPRRSLSKEKNKLVNVSSSKDGRSDSVSKRDRRHHHRGHDRSRSRGGRRSSRSRSRDRKRDKRSRSRDRRDTRRRSGRSRSKSRSRSRSRDRDRRHRRR